jgi:transcription initiation factor IIE alpha subunit
MAGHGWMSIKDISNKLKISSEKVRTTLMTLREKKEIRWRNDPRDKRKIQVEAADLEIVMQALGLSEGDVDLGADEEVEIASE